MSDCTQCLGLANCTVPSTNSTARLGHAEKAPHRAQEPGHRKEHQSRVRFGSCSMSVTVRNAWINKIPGVWVLERYLEVKTSREVEISQDAKEWHHASTTTQSSRARHITAPLQLIYISQPSGGGMVWVFESGDGDLAPIIPDYRTVNNSLALRTHPSDYQLYLITTY